MCAGAMIHARIDRLVYAAADPKAGAAVSVLTVLNHPQLNHQMAVENGVLAEEARSCCVGSFGSGDRAQGGTHLLSGRKGRVLGALSFSGMHARVLFFFDGYGSA